MDGFGFGALATRHANIYCAPPGFVVPETHCDHDKPNLDRRLVLRGKAVQIQAEGAQMCSEAVTSSSVDLTFFSLRYSSVWTDYADMMAILPA